MRNQNNFTQEQQYAFVNNLKTYLGLYKKTQGELAEKIGTTQPTVSSWVNGRNMPNKYFLDKIATAFMITQEQLLDKDLGREHQEPITTTNVVEENEAVSVQDNLINFIENYFKETTKIKDYISSLIIENDDLKKENAKLKAKLEKFSDIKEQLSHLFE